MSLGRMFLCNEQFNDRKVENPFTTRIAGFGKGLTIEEMQKYSEILNTFKPMYTNEA